MNRHVVLLLAVDAHSLICCAFHHSIHDIKLSWVYNNNLHCKSWEFSSLGLLGSTRIKPFPYYSCKHHNYVYLCVLYLVGLLIVHLFIISFSLNILDFYKAQIRCKC